MLTHIKTEQIDEVINEVTELRIKEEPLDSDEEEIKPNDAPYSCEKCGKRFKIRRNCEKHIKAIHETGRSYVCKHCGKRFTSRYFLSTHKAEHMKEFEFKCDKCECGYVRLRDLQLHQNVRHGTPSFSCEKCGKGFYGKYSFEKHMAAHEREKKGYPCGVCSTVLGHKRSYDRHMRRHKGTMEVKCDICGISVSRIDYLTIHKRTHIVDRSYQCDHCEKIYKCEIALKRHLKNHKV